MDRDRELCTKADSSSLLERCKLLTRWAFEYFDQTRTTSLKPLACRFSAVLVGRHLRPLVPTVQGMDNSDCTIRSRLRLRFH